jgi:hypothetical protein
LAQIFPRSANHLPLILAVAGILGPTAAVGGVWYYFSPRFTDVGYRPIQPVPYSHKLHAGKMHIDCRYCHASVEVSAVANVPPTQVCMNCHRLIGVDRPTLEPIRQSFASGRPMRWVRVHKLPDYAYFDHHAHVRAGVGCVTCHGHIEKMEVSEVTNMTWTPPRDPEARARLLAQLRPVHPPTHCTGCHR